MAVKLKKPVFKHAPHSLYCTDIVVHGDGYPFKDVVLRVLTWYYQDAILQSCMECGDKWAFTVQPRQWIACWKASLLVVLMLKEEHFLLPSPSWQLLYLSWLFMPARRVNQLACLNNKGRPPFFICIVDCRCCFFIDPHWLLFSIHRTHSWDYYFIHDYTYTCQRKEKLHKHLVSSCDMHESSKLSKRNSLSCH